MKTLLKLKTLAAAAGMFGLSVVGANAMTMVDTVNDSFTVEFECLTGDECPDSTNIADVDLSALATFTLTLISGNSWYFDVTVSNTTPTSTDGTNRLTALGFATDPNATIAFGADLNSNGIDWDAAAGFIPGFQNYVELCAFVTNSCTSASGGATNGVQEASSDSFSIILTTATLVNSLSFSDFAVKFASAGADGGSFEFGGVPVSPVPLPAAGWVLIAGIGSLAALRRRRRA